MSSANSGKRAAMLQVAGEARLLVAPVNRTTGQPAVFDPGKHGAIDLAAPPAPWIYAGSISSVRRVSETAIAPLRAGSKGAVAAQSRQKLDARVEFTFCEWGKLQMAIACGSQHMNVLAADANAAVRPSGGAAIPPVALLPGSTATELIVGAAAVSGFAAGDVVAVDVNYAQQVGYVGTGIAGAYVRAAADVNNDADYIRRVTFNVARVAAKSATSLLLDKPLLGGAPAANAGVQKVVGFVDREGGSFFQEWSAVFVVESRAGGRVCFYYPRLRPVQPSAEERVELGSGFAAHLLRASLLALPATDTNDGEQIVCWRSLIPAANAASH